MKIQWIVFLVISGSLGMSCSSFNRTNTDQTSPRAEEELKKIDGSQPLEKSLSLIDDREFIDAERQKLLDESEASPELRATNDELGEVLKYVYTDAEEDPSKLRSRFQTALRKRRAALDKSARRARDFFSKDERKNRELFLAQIKRDREIFLGSRPDGKQKTQFFADQDLKRRDFFSEQSDRRRDFESRLTDQKKSAEEILNQKRGQFDNEWREYQRRYNERRALLKKKSQLEKKSAELERSRQKSEASRRTNEIENEFKSIPEGKGIPLGSGGGNAEGQ